MESCCKLSFTRKKKWQYFTSSSFVSFALIVNFSNLISLGEETTDSYSEHEKPGLCWCLGNLSLEIQYFGPVYSILRAPQVDVLFRGIPPSMKKLSFISITPCLFHSQRIQINDCDFSLPFVSNTLIKCSLPSSKVKSNCVRYQWIIAYLLHDFN